ncbi:MotA/TolQ/ExbB proton channel family protein [Wenzhouxiangella sp. XN79A]|uniref:MotA/TolQ/ExbB proton channel family protein n=1 Tax=Wenzhouxiangella sp. XN79A TaxID=2724193 RepID=UPI00144AF4CA|nr:MotA/TolQ/ExbB proton channel family protein [Wenzhouxiangella sp. XN79A]NKI33651.1 MotA/TolQ/ExbB proton channel family protein [Wenzhouxiangella sp. XN79A]
MFALLSDDLRFYFEIGGYVMPPLVVATFILWFAIGYRFAALRRGSARSARVLLQRNAKRVRHAPRGLIERAVLRGLEIAEQNPPNLRRWLDDAFAEYETTTKRFHKLILTIVTVAPLLGLLGTVSGMIETFDSLADMSLFSQSGGIAGGISQALFTTQMGLAVAIPGLVVGGLLDRKALHLRTELAQVKDLICAEHEEAKTA